MPGAGTGRFNIKGTLSLPSPHRKADKGRQATEDALLARRQERQIEGDKKKIENLEDEVEKLRDNRRDLESVRVQLSFQKKQVARLEKECSTKEESLASLRLHFKEKRSNSSSPDLDTIIRSLDDAAISSSYKSELDNMTKDLDRARAQIGTMHVEILTLGEAVEIYKSRISQLENSGEIQVEEKKRFLEEIVQELESEKAVAAKTIATLQEERAAHKERIKEGGLKNSVLDQERTKVHNINKELQKENTRLLGLCIEGKGVEEFKKRSQAEIEQLEKELLGAQNKINQLETEQKEGCKELDGLVEWKKVALENRNVEAQKLKTAEKDLADFKKKMPAEFKAANNKFIAAAEEKLAAGLHTFLAPPPSALNESPPNPSDPPQTQKFKKEINSLNADFPESIKTFIFTTTQHVLGKAEESQVSIVKDKLYELDGKRRKEYEKIEKYWKATREQDMTEMDSRGSTILNLREKAKKDGEDQQKMKEEYETKLRKEREVQRAEMEGCEMQWRARVEEVNKEVYVQKELVRQTEKALEEERRKSQAMPLASSKTNNVKSDASGSSFAVNKLKQQVQDLNKEVLELRTTNMDLLIEMGNM